MTGTDDLGLQLRMDNSEHQENSTMIKLNCQTNCSPVSSPDEHEGIKQHGLWHLPLLTEFGSSNFSLDPSVRDKHKPATLFDTLDTINTRSNPSMFAYSTQSDHSKSHRIQELYPNELASPDDSMERRHSTTQDKLFTIEMRGQSLICLEIDGQRRLCLAQISSTLLQQFSYNEIHNRRVALGITCVQCTPSQLELLRDAGAMPTSSRRCGTITYREAERLVKSFLDEPEHPKLPENFAFNVIHHCGWGCQGTFMPARYSSSRAKCVRCDTCQAYFSPNKFIFHCHLPNTSETASNQIYRHPDAANFNAWRRHLYLANPKPSVDLLYAWEDVKAMFNGGNRKRAMLSSSSDQSMEYQTDDTIRCGGDNHDNDHDDDDDDDRDDDNEDDRGLINNNPKHSKVYINRKVRRSTYSECALTMDKLTANRNQSKTIQTSSSTQSNKCREFLIENMIGDQNQAQGRDQHLASLHKHDQIDPLNLSFYCQTSKPAFRKHPRNPNVPSKHSHSRCDDVLIHSDQTNGASPHYCSSNHQMTTESTKSSQSNLVRHKINPYDSPKSLFPNLFSYPPLLSVTNRNEMPNSTLNNSWPLLFLNHVFQMIGTVGSHPSSNLAIKQPSEVDTEVGNLYEPRQPGFHSLAAFGTKSTM